MYLRISNPSYEPSERSDLGIPALPDQENGTLALFANKAYLKWAQKKGEENPKVAQKASCLLVCSEDEYDLMNTKQRDEGKSRFGHPRRENQRAEQEDQEVGKVDEPDFKIEILTIQKACKALGFFSDC